MNTTGQRLVWDLMEKRQNAVAAYADYRRAFAEFEASNAVLIEKRNEAQVQLDAAEAALRIWAVDQYMATGQKRPLPGVEIKLGKALVYDPAQALQWALEHRVALSLDKKVFERVAEASCPALVKVEEKPVAYIATDLSKHYTAAQ